MTNYIKKNKFGLLAEKSLDSRINEVELQHEEKYDPAYQNKYANMFYIHPEFTRKHDNFKIHLKQKPLEYKKRTLKKTIPTKYWIYKINKPNGEKPYVGKSTKKTIWERVNIHHNHYDIGDEVICLNEYVPTFTSVGHLFPISCTDWERLDKDTRHATTKYVFDIMESWYIKQYRCQLRNIKDEHPPTFPYHFKPPFLKIPFERKGWGTKYNYEFPDFVKDEDCFTKGVVLKKYGQRTAYKGNSTWCEYCSLSLTGGPCDFIKHRKRQKHENNVTKSIEIKPSHQKFILSNLN
jgi:hypothetical protein